MDRQYENQFPDEMVRVRTELNSEMSRLTDESAKLEKIEELYTDFDNVGAVNVEAVSFPHPAQDNPTFEMKLTAHVTSLKEGPVGELLQMGGTAYYDDDGEMALYTIENTFTFQV